MKKKANIFLNLILMLIAAFTVGVVLGANYAPITNQIHIPLLLSATFICFVTLIKVIRFLLKSNREVSDN